MKIQMEEISNRVSISKIKYGDCCRLGSVILFVYKGIDEEKRAVDLHTGIQISISNDILVFPIEIEAKGLTRY